ncbi:MAG: hypothetical protein AAFV49_08900 [Pseudomonadota bacterium]
MAFDTISWLGILGLGAACGIAGQTARVVVGLKKAQDAAAADPDPEAAIKSQRILVSLLIGAAAGSLAGIYTLDDPNMVSQEEVLGLIAAGYAGADFIEGVMKKLKPPTT